MTSLAMLQSFDSVMTFVWARNALLATILVAVLCATLGLAVVLKRMAFIGQGVSHAAFGGVGTAMLLGLGGLALDGLVLVFCIMSALLIGVLSRKRVERDTAIGILLVAAMAWGVTADRLSVILQDSWPWYARQLADQTPMGFENVLFGSVLTVTTGWLGVVAVVTVGLMVLLVTVHRSLLFFLFDEQTSAVYGVRSRWLNQMLLVSLAVCIVLTMRVAGVILATALLVLPAATALQLSRKWPWVWLWSLGIGLGGCGLGLMLSLEFEQLLPGPTMVLVLSAVFGGVWMVRVFSKSA